MTESAKSWRAIFLSPLLALVLSALSQGVLAQTCSKGPLYDPGNKIFGNFDCLLHPGTLQTSAGHACPGQNPFLNVTAHYSCEECGINGPGTSLTANGLGDCSLDAPCSPVLLNVTYDVVWLQINIRNMRQLAGFCVQSGTTQSTGYCACPACDKTPILISLNDRKVRLTSADRGVLFDLDADGEPEATAWTAARSDEAFLALDRNGNGVIDDGSELFGNATVQPVVDGVERNGFEALKVFDDRLSGGDENGWIDGNDQIFAELLLWIDSNHNGWSEPDELFALAARGIEAIELDYHATSRRDRFGNEFLFRSRVEAVQGIRQAWDVAFSQDAPGG